MSRLTRAMLDKVNQGRSVSGFVVGWDVRSQYAMLKMKLTDGAVQRLFLPAIMIHHIGVSFRKTERLWRYAKREVVEEVLVEDADWDAATAQVARSAEVHADRDGAHVAALIDEPKQIYFTVRFRPTCALAIAGLVEEAVGRGDIWFLNQGKPRDRPVN